MSSTVNVEALAKSTLGLEDSSKVSQSELDQGKEDWSVDCSVCASSLCPSFDYPTQNQPDGPAFHHGTW
jgi:hypothetical protein